MGRLADVVEELVAVVGPEREPPARIARVPAALLLAQQGRDDPDHVHVPAEMLGLRERAVRVLGHVAQMDEVDPLREALGDGGKVVAGPRPE